MGKSSPAICNRTDQPIAKRCARLLESEPAPLVLATGRCFLLGPFATGLLLLRKLMHRGEQFFGEQLSFRIFQPHL